MDLPPEPTFLLAGTVPECLRRLAVAFPDMEQLQCAVSTFLEHAREQPLFSIELANLKPYDFRNNKPLSFVLNRLALDFETKLGSRAFLDVAQHYRDGLLTGAQERANAPEIAPSPSIVLAATQGKKYLKVRKPLDVAKALNNLGK